MKNITLILFILPLFGLTQGGIFTYEEFVKIVRLHHPIAYQSGLQLEKGKAYLMKAKGGFDPKLDAGIDQKYFKDNMYFSHLNSKLKVPTWFGITAQAGYDNNEGVYLNPEFNSPNNGLFNAGLSITLGKGLFIDERRAELKQAKIYLNSSALEQKIILNRLIFNASVTYWKWKSTYLKLQVYREAIVNAEVRLGGVKQSVVFGDKPAIDTVEAKIILQNRQLNYYQAEFDFNSMRQKMNVYLWQAGFIPLELDSLSIPNLEMTYDQDLGFFNDSLIENHPEVLLYQNKIEIQKIDNRLQKESLKPTLNLSYDFINEPIENNPFVDANLNNYKWGATFSYPLFIRKERANIRLSEIKLKEIGANNELKKASIKYKVQAIDGNIKNLANQLKVANETIVNYNQLFISENTLFEIGESSVFMINYRESAYIKSQLKAVEIYEKLLSNTQEFKYQLFTE
ncbi:MAG: TolC family protein [Flavobacteriales bacterium]|tara:strand:+ start:305 stop:1672 length:1368 start_codon:yes stop_codon:yes gene_type:complete